jgi:hypothetical protein
VHAVATFSQEDLAKMEGSTTKRKRSSSGAKRDEEKGKTKRLLVVDASGVDKLEMRLKALHAEAKRAAEELDWFEASDKWTSLLAMGEGHTSDRVGQLRAAALRGRCQVSLKLKRFERAVEDGRRLVELVGHQDVESHLLLSRALFLSALRVPVPSLMCCFSYLSTQFLNLTTVRLYQQEESVAWTGSRIRPYERQRHLKLYQQAFDTLHHATQVPTWLHTCVGRQLLISLMGDRLEQLYPESEERLKREADVIKPHLEWLTALPDELCIKVFGFLSKKQLHKVPHRLFSADSFAGS